VWAIVSPLLLLLATREWVFTSPGYIDPWHYVGFFLNYTEPLYWDDAYKLARLPWILSGALTYWAAPAWLAPYLLHLGSLLLLTAGFYQLVHALFGSRAIAALAAMLIGFFTNVHGSGGWDYHNTAAGPYYVWALYLTTRAATNPAPLRLALAGCLGALAMHANITLVNFLPILALHWFTLRRHAAGGSVSMRECWRAGVWAIAGATAVTVLLMSVSVAVGRPALFFGRLIDIVVRYVTDPSQQAGYTNGWAGGWLLNARYLALDVAMLGMSAALLVFPAASRRALIQHRLVWLEFCLASMIWACWQSLGQTALDYDYFAYPLIAHAMLALLAIVSTRIDGSPLSVLVLTPGILMLPLALGLQSLPQPWIVSANALGAAIPGFLTFVMAIGALWTPRRVRTIAFIALYACANALSGPSRYAVGNLCRPSEDFHAAIVSVNRLVAATDPKFLYTRLWFQESDSIPVGSHCTLRVSDVGYAVAGLGVPYLVSPFPMPPVEAIPTAVFEGLARGDLKLLVVSGRTETEKLLEHHLDGRGIDYVVGTRQQLPVLEGSIHVTLADLRLRTTTTAASPASGSDPQ
jgi:hypothetical protein